MPTQNVTSSEVLFGQVMAGCTQFALAMVHSASGGPPTYPDQLLELTAPPAPLALATVVPPNASPALSKAAEPPVSRDRIRRMGRSFGVRKALQDGIVLSALYICVLLLHVPR